LNDPFIPTRLYSTPIKRFHSFYVTYAKNTGDRLYGKLEMSGSLMPVRNIVTENVWNFIRGKILLGKLFFINLEFGAVLAFSTILSAVSYIVLYCCFGLHCCGVKLLHFICVLLLVCAMWAALR